MVSGQFSGSQFSSGAIVQGAIFLGGSYQRGNCLGGRGLCGDNFPRGQLFGHQPELEQIIVNVTTCSVSCYLRSILMNKI